MALVIISIVSFNYSLLIIMSRLIHIFDYFIIVIHCTFYDKLNDLFQKLFIENGHSKFENIMVLLWP